MMQPFWKDGTVWWALGLVLGTPAAILILGELIAACRRRKHPLGNTLLGIRNLLLPAAAVYIMVVCVAEVDRDEVYVRLLLTLVAVSLLNTILSACNVLVFGQTDRELSEANALSKQVSWQSRIPKLVRELVRFALIVVGSGLALSNVWEINLGNVLAALGVGSIVLGLALQEPLGNLFSGLMLTFERPFEVGDWIQVGDKAGEVVEVNWRAVHLLTGGKDLQIIPNSSLAKNNFGNYSRPTRQVADSVEIKYPATEPPNRVKEVLLGVVRATPGVLADPAPAVRTTTHDPSSFITYKIAFHVADYKDAAGVRDEVLTRLWYAGHRAGLCLTAPTQTSISMTKDEAEGVSNAALTEEELRPFRQFGLTEVEAVADHLRRRSVKRYARGERVMVEGQGFAGLYLVLGGEARLTVTDAAGGETTIGRVARGDFFGEKSLLSCQSSDMTATAESDLEVLALDGDQLHALLVRTPRLAREIGQVMEARRQAIQRVRGTMVLGRACGQAAA